jgi:ABC-type transport system substrate-binding protein
MRIILAVIALVGSLQLVACSGGGGGSALPQVSSAPAPTSTAQAALSVTLPSGQRPPATGAPGTVVAPANCQLIGHTLSSGLVLYTSTDNPCLTVVS